MNKKCMYNNSSSRRFFALFALFGIMFSTIAFASEYCGKTPKFAWRGHMLDVARHFFTVDDIKKTLDLMHEHNLNVFHWHLTDHDGWRLQLDCYPKLTEVGSVRKASSKRTTTMGLDVVDGDYGPFFYTKDQVREIIRYAAERGIRIVPEIEFPGHSSAAVRAYPQLGCTGLWNCGEFCLGKESTYEMFKKILDEVCELFPGEVIHIGGDECTGGNWKKCADCQGVIKKYGLKDTHALQGWATKRMAEYLEKKGRRMMGWDELSSWDDLPRSVIIQSYRGASFGVAAAKKGFDVVMSPDTFCYLDYVQGLEGDKEEYQPFGVYLNVEKIARFDPCEGVPQEFKKHILGGQGNLWTELVPDRKGAEWRVWPRLAAIADVLKNGPAADTQVFMKRMGEIREDLVKRGINAAPLGPLFKMIPDLLPGARYESIKADNGKRWDFAKMLDNPLDFSVLRFNHADKSDSFRHIFATRDKSMKKGSYKIDLNFDKIEMWAPDDEGFERGLAQLRHLARHKRSGAMEFTGAVIIGEGDNRTLEEAFLSPPPGYGEVPFWWWTGDVLNKERIAEQLRSLHAKGVSGTQVNYAHLMMNGWPTMPVEPAIFSPEWWDVFKFAAEESGRLGMGIGLSGYTLDWPGCDNLYRKLGIDSPETRARVIKLVDGKVTVLERENTLDPLNPESAKRVLERFIKPFWEKVPQSCHNALDYFFQDELRLAGDSYVWSDDFPEEFKKRKGYDIVPKLALLLGNEITEEVSRLRLDYNDVMVELTEERYFRPIYNWHACRGRVYACDSSSRGLNPIEFGDYMRNMRWYTAPGFDTPGGKADPVKCKMGSSISHLYRRPRVWLEGYHSQGWQASTSSIFDATARNYVWGANLLNLHGLYYSTYGGWFEWAPPCYHFHQPYWELMDTTLKYFERLSYMLTRGKHVADVAILTPQEPCVVDIERALKSSVPLAHELVKHLAVEGTTDCDYIDSKSILSAEIEEDDLGVALVVSGERYRVILLPDMFAMRQKVKEKLAEFSSRGGRVIDVKKVEDVKLPLMAKPDVAGNKGLKYIHRKLDDADIYYFVDWDAKSDIRLRAKGGVEYWDLWTGRKISSPRPGEPLLVVVKKGSREAVVPAVSTQEKADVLTVGGKWRVSFVPTMDNKWGDYRLPAFNGKIGPEVRAMRWVEESRTENLGFGPQFFVETKNGNLPSSGAELYNFSWRYGVFDKPGNQNNYHGLNRIVSDQFFVMGPYDAKGYYDMDAPQNDRSLKTTYKTFVYAPHDLVAIIAAEAETPWAIDPQSKEKWKVPSITSLKVAGRDVEVGRKIRLKAGWSSVEVLYEGYGRASLVLADVTLGKKYIHKKPLPLSMKWNSLGGRLNYDPFAGKHKKGTFVASVPPGTVDAIVDVHGKVLKKEIKDGLLTLEIEFKEGFVGGNAFNDVVKLVVDESEMSLGDWARFEGLRCYSGGAIYKKTVNVPKSFLFGSKRLELDLGSVGCAAKVSLNGKDIGSRTCPPWTIDVTDSLREGKNEIAVTVYNTLNNHYQSIPTRYKVSTDRSPSGLLGPVTLKSYLPKAVEVAPRKGIGNVLSKLQRGENVTIGYLGGSITEQGDDATSKGGWRVKTTKWLRQKYPQAQIKEINAAIGGTGSDLGVYRVGDDVLKHKPDLVFVEFACNDGGDYGRADNILRSMEGIVRQTLKRNPRTDIVFAYTITTAMTNTYSKGFRPLAARCHDAVAEHYGIPTVDFGPRIWQAVLDDKLMMTAHEIETAVPKSDPEHDKKVRALLASDSRILFSNDGVHPRDEGHDFYLQSIVNAFSQMEGLAGIDRTKTLSSAVREDNSENAKLVEIKPSMLSGEWVTLPCGDKKYDDLKFFSGRFNGDVFLARKPGAKISFRFKGKACRIYDLLGPDCGQVWVTLDGVRNKKPVPRFDSYCTYYRLHNFLVGEVPYGVHTVEIELDKDQPSRKSVAFRLSNPEKELKTDKYNGTSWLVGKIMVDGDVL